MASKRSRVLCEEDLTKRESPFVFIGTALPPLDEHTRDDGSYVPAWKQEVTDDRGRKRLHGAFTGGYSAGYFNTVGSKDGWTPAAFKSSRQNRAKDSQSHPASQQRPEDFMDEEDMREDEESKQLSTAAGYAGFGSTDEDMKRQDGFTDLFRPTGETVGVRLLKRMGWKPGQGIGPKILRKAKLADELQGEEGEAAPIHLFAPEDPPIISFTRKLDRKGLGFEGETGLEDNSDRLRQKGDLSEEENESAGPLVRSNVMSKRDLKAKKGAFGVGVLNDTGSDDEDPYQIGPNISYNRVMGADKKTRRRKDGLQAASNPRLKERPVFKSKNAPGKPGFRKCDDGRLPLDGFVLSTELDSFASMDLQDEKYRPPAVPEGWVSEKQPSGEQGQPASYVSTAEAAKVSHMDATTRARLLGEAQLPGKSVFDYLTPAARERIASASGNPNLPAALGEKAGRGKTATSENRAQQLQDLVPKLDSAVAMQALSRGSGGWMPYAEDGGKRERYQAFLAIRAGLQDGLPERKDGMSNEDWMHEMEEFARAAQVFQPVSGLMASRFTSSSQHAGPASDRLDSSASGDELLSRPPEKREDAAVKAAQMGMFGALTRTVKDFYPTRLLCKRFNVKPATHVQAEPGHEMDRGNATQQAASQRFQPAGYQLPAMPNKPSRPSPIVDAERNEALEAERPGEEVFKAIFGSDDEDD